LNDALLATGFPFRSLDILEDYIAIFRILCSRTLGIRRPGSAALDLCYLACGRFDGFWEFGLHPWDTAAGSLIVEEAGGFITRLEGKPLELKTQNVLAGNPAIYKALKGKVALGHHSPRIVSKVLWMTHPSRLATDLDSRP